MMGKLKKAREEGIENEEKREEYRDIKEEQTITILKSIKREQGQRGTEYDEE